MKKKNSARLQGRIDDVLRDLPLGERRAGGSASGLETRERRLIDIQGALARLPPLVPCPTVCRVDVPYFGSTWTVDDCGGEDIFIT